MATCSCNCNDLIGSGQPLCIYKIESQSKKMYSRCRDVHVHACTSHNNTMMVAKRDRHCCCSAVAAHVNECSGVQNPHRYGKAPGYVVVYIN